MGRKQKSTDDEQLDAEIGARLARIRAEKRWSQTDLAARLDISAAQLNGLESGRFSFSAALLLKLSRLLGEPVTALLGSDPPPDNQAREWARLFDALPRRDRAVLTDLARKLEGWSRAFSLTVERRPAQGPGRLVSLEGIDGVLLREVGEKLTTHMRRGGEVAHCWYDHDSPLWQYMMQRFRQIDDKSEHQVLERTLLFACERLYRQETAVRPQLARGSTVIAPFYTMAPGVYQEMEGVGDTRFIDIVDSLLLPPDVIIVVRSDPEVAARRAVGSRPAEGQFYSPYGVHELERARSLYDKAVADFTARGYQVRCVDVQGMAVTRDLIDQLGRMASPMVSSGAA